MPLVSHYLRRIQFAPILLSDVIIGAVRGSVNRGEGHISTAAPGGRREAPARWPHRFPLESEGSPESNVAQKGSECLLKGSSADMFSMGRELRPSMIRLRFRVQVLGKRRLILYDRY